MKDSIKILKDASIYYIGLVQLALLGCRSYITNIFKEAVNSYLF